LEPLASLLDARLLLVTGKGGTGKTTLAAALALLGEATGRRVLCCEVDAQRPSLPAALGLSAPTSSEAVALRPRLHVANLAWKDSLAEFLATVVPSRRVVSMALGNAAVARFLDFTPGSREIVTLSALAARTAAYDLVVVDMPASGHAFSLLDITRSAIGLFRSGPVRARAEQLRDLLLDPRTRLALVALPEEMVVIETLETADRLRAHGLLSGAPMVVLNRATPPSLTEPERVLLDRLAAQPDLDPTQREFVRAGRWEATLEVAAAEATAVFEERLGVVPMSVPPAPAGLAPSDVALHVATVLGRRVGLTRRDLP
jgi:anion-transporting  ArsA/GET3 family ATPase